MESLAASLAASSVSDTVIDQLKPIVKRQAELITFDRDHLDELAQLDEAFHLTISEASGNDIVHEILCHINPAFIEGNKAILYAGRREKLMLVDHQAIVEAIEARDPSKAERQMKAHLSRVQQELKELVA